VLALCQGAARSRKLSFAKLGKNSGKTKEKDIKNYNWYQYDKT